MSSTYVGTGLGGLPLTYTLENDTDYDRVEVVGVHAGFPDGINSVDEADLLSKCYLYLDGGRETIGFGMNTGNPSRVAIRWDMTIPWVASLNAITAGSGNILPGSCKLVYYAENGEYVEVYDTPINATTGRWTYTRAGVNYITASLITYNTGTVSITFNSSRKPDYGSSNKAEGLPIRMTFSYANPVKYPTQWSVTRTWPSGRVRQAKAWIGQASGVGMFVSKRVQTHAVYWDAAGTQAQPANSNFPGADKIKEYTRGYLRLGVDDGTVNAGLPTYALHADMADALNSSLSNLSSQLFDHNGNQYLSRTLNTADDFEVNVLENPALNSDKGWMRVYQKRGYHAPTSPTYASATRDMFSLTSYFYVPHNNRLFDVETRLGNEYQGYDPLDHSYEETLGTGNGSNRAFSRNLEHVFSTNYEDGPMRQGRVWLYIGGVPVAHDRKGDGVLRRITGNNIVDLNATTNNYGSINYSSGAITVNVPGVAPAPGSGVAVTCRYVSRAVHIGNISGTGTLNVTLPSKANQYGVYVRVGKSVASLHEAWDAGGAFNASVGYLAPMLANSVVEGELVESANLTATETGTLATNLHPGSVEFYVSTSVEGALATFFCRDNGNGGWYGRNVSSGTIDYATGAFSITFSSTPAVGTNLYASYKRNTAALPVSGSITYATDELTVTVSSSVPSNTPVYVTYVRNLLSGKNIDPNAYPLGSAGFSRWLMLFSSTYLDMECDAGPSYNVVKGANYITMVGANSKRDNITSSSVPEYLHDGSSLPRLLRCYAKNNAVTADNNNWLAKKSHPLTAIPTLDCYNATLAFGTHEGALKVITPQQYIHPFYTTSRSFSEDMCRSGNSAAVVYPPPPTGGYGTNVPLGQFNNRSSLLSALTEWNDGNIYASGQWQGTSPRNGLGWIENWNNGVSSGGAGRVGQDFSLYIYYSQAHQFVSYLYHAGLFPCVRPGASAWNIAMRSKWEDRAYRNYIPGAASSGMLTNITGANRSYGQPFGVDYLGRAHKAGWSVGKLSVVNGSTTITFEPNIGSVSGVFSWVGYTQTYTATGTTQLEGMRRIAIQGSSRLYTINSVSYNASTLTWSGTLSSAFTGPTSTAAVYGLCNDVRPGTDVPYIRNNPNLCTPARLGCGRLAWQHSIEGDASSHQAAFTAFDTWCVTGHWGLWDITRHHADWNMASCKQYNNWEFQQDQMRTSAWHLRCVLTGHTVTKALTGRAGFEFLTDPLYGGAADRYKEWLTIRMSQWVDLGATGQMDPQGTIAVGDRSKIRDIRISSTSDKADWYSCSAMGNVLPVYGGNGTLTEAQVRYDQIGFHYVSVWEIGYLTPWAFATYREFRQDTTLIDLPQRGETGKTFGEIVSRVFDGYARLFVDYFYIDKRQHICSRGAPGYYQTALGFTPGYFGWSQVTSGANTNSSLPVQWLAYPVSVDGSTLNYGSVRQQYINQQITFGPEVSGDDYVATQVYWLRGASRTLGLTVSEPVDRLGWPLNNSGWLNAGWPTDSDSTFSQQLTPSDTAWHFPGVPYPYPPGPLIPGQVNDTGNELRNGTRIPLYPEAFNTLGLSHSNGAMLNTVTFLFTSQVARFHPDAGLRARAGDLVNKYLTQAMAFSLIGGNQYDGVDTHYNKGQPIEINFYAGPITGAYPYSTDSGIQPVDRWWDLAYKSRRRLGALPEHSDLATGTGVFAINLSDYGIDDKALQDDTSDVRVVLQYADGSYVLCESVVRPNATGDFTLFVSMPVDLANGEGVSAASTTLAWYVYYTNISSGPAPWTNINSPQAPYASDASTEVLWNQNGNYATDASPNNWPLGSIGGLDPAYSDGPVGGAISFSAAGLSTAFSASAVNVTRAGSSYLGSNFTVEFNLYVAANNLAKYPNVNYGLMSLADDDVFPIVSYIETATRNINFLASLGTIGGGYAFNGGVVPGQFSDSVSGPDGILDTFGFSLTRTNILPGSVSLALSDGSAVVAKDDGAGAFTGDGITSGTINYSSGAISIVFDDAPADTLDIVAYYSTVAVPNGWKVSAWNHIRFSYNGSSIILSVNGTQVGSAVAAGSLQSIGAESTTVFNLGSLFSPSLLWNARSTVELSEFRVSSSNRGLAAFAAEPLVATLFAEETQVVQNTASLSVSAYIAAQKTKNTTAVATVSHASLEKAATCEANVLTVYNELVAATSEAAVMSVDEVVIGDITASVSVEARRALPCTALVADFKGNGSLVTGVAMVALPAEHALDVVCDVTAVRPASATIVATVQTESLVKQDVDAVVLSDEVTSVYTTVEANIRIADSDVRLTTVATVQAVKETRLTTTASVATVDIRKAASCSASVYKVSQAIADVAVEVTPSNLFAYVEAVATAATQGRVLQSVVAEIAGTLYERSQSVGADATVSFEGITYGVEAFAAVATSPSVSATCTGAIALEDRLAAVLGVANLLVNDSPSTAVCVAAVINNEQEAIDCVASIESPNGTSYATVVASVIQDGGLTSFSVAVASVQVNNKTTPATSEAVVALRRTHEVSAEGLVSFLRMPGIPCLARVDAVDIFTDGLVSVATVATRNQATAPAVAAASVTRSRNLVCRANVVIELTQNLNASGIDYVEGGGIND